MLKMYCLNITEDKHLFIKVLNWWKIFSLQSYLYFYVPCLNLQKLKYAESYFSHL